MIYDVVLPALVAGVVSFLVALGTTEYRMKREQTVDAQQEIQSWYADTAQLASTIQILWKNEYEEKHAERGPIRHDEIQRQMKLLSRQVTNHISDSKSVNVDQNIVDGLEELSRLCSSLQDVRIGLNEREEFRVKGREMVEHAEDIEEQVLSKISAEP